MSRLRATTWDEAWASSVARCAGCCVCEDGSDIVRGGAGAGAEERKDASEALQALVWMRMGSFDAGAAGDGVVVAPSPNYLQGAMVARQPLLMRGRRHGLPSYLGTCVGVEQCAV